MKTKTIIFAIALMIGARCFAQLGTPLHQFTGNQIAYNPAYAGVYDLLAINLTVHKSWVQLPGSPRLVNFNGHAPFRNQRHAMGFVYQNDSWGPLQGNFVLGNYSYKMYFDRSILSFGVQAGAMIHQTNWNKFSPEDIEDWEDPTLKKGRINEAKFDANFGVYYMAPRFYTGFSVLHLTSPKYNKTEVNNKEYFSQMPSQFIFIGGYNIPINFYWDFRPEVFVRYLRDSPVSVNAGLHAHYMNRFSLGVNFMTGQKGVCFQARGLITDRVRVGYSYAAFWGDIKPYQKGTHEIQISYLILDVWGKARTVDLLWL